MPRSKSRIYVSVKWRCGRVARVGPQTGWNAYWIFRKAFASIKLESFPWRRSGISGLIPIHFQQRGFIDAVCVHLTGPPADHFLLKMRESPWIESDKTSTSCWAVEMISCNKSHLHLAKRKIAAMNPSTKKITDEHFHPQNNSKVSTAVFCSAPLLVNALLKP